MVRVVNNLQQQHVLADVKNAFQHIGYHQGWMQDRYRFADLYATNTREQEIALGIFGQKPLDYRSACFGLEFKRTDESPEIALNRMRALGAPQLFYVINDTTQRWKIHADRVSIAETVPTHSLDKLIKDHQHTWNPQAILRAKAGFLPPTPQQIDFIDMGLLPALEHEASRKIDRLVHRVCSLAEGFHQERQIELDAANLFSLIFQLIVGKLLMDRGITTIPPIDFSNVKSVLGAVCNYYPSKDLTALHDNVLPQVVLQRIADEIAGSFSFANLSAETLTYVYENTFVSASSRKDLGIHSTPSYLADYILSQLPLEQIPQDQWNIWDPTCGHGIFLIAAMRRMRTLLPEDWSAYQRHQFFSKRLHGIDIERFSIEVAKLCLMLADFPEANGWDLLNRDVFTGNLIEERAKTMSIIVGNPPFEALEQRKPLVRKPAELLRRMLPHMPKGAMLGMVLPRAFLDGSEYRKERDVLLRQFDLINVTALPDRIFTYSEVETSIVIARKLKEKSSFFLYREVHDNDRPAFQNNFKSTWEEHIPNSYFTTNGNDVLAIPRLRHIWQALANRPTLASIAKIHTGIRYKSRKHHLNLRATFYKKDGELRKLGIESVTDSFMQYTATGQQYFSIDPELQENKAYLCAWNEEKVIVPASRTARGPWRYAAALDRNGLCVSRRFYAIWPRKEDAVMKIHASVIAAILNAPVAMAYIYTHTAQKDITVKAYGAIPMPRLNYLAQAQGKLADLVEHYIRLCRNPNNNEIALKTALLDIDAEVMRLYDLPPKLERQLLDLFWGDTRRRVPFDFHGYIPPDFEPWIPLHIFISPGFAKSSAGIIRESLPKRLASETLQFFRDLVEKDDND